MSKFLNVKVPDQWLEFGIEPFKYSLEKIRAHEEDAIWWTYVAIFREENTVIGNGGYKGPPDKEGMVEIGYQVGANHRLRGFATEMAQGFLQYAFENPVVKTVRAHTLAEENASTKVLRKCGMKWIEEVNDPEDGLLWRWEIKG